MTAYGQTFSVVYGRSIAGPIWQQLMTTLHAKLPARAFASPAATALTGLAPPLPQVVGLPRDVAITALLHAGYRVRLDPQTSAASDSVGPGQVAEQQPASGTTLAYGATVTLTLTAGSDLSVTIPEPWQIPAG